MYCFVVSVLFCIMAMVMKLIHNVSLLLLLFGEFAVAYVVFGYLHLYIQ